MNDFEKILAHEFPVSRNLIYLNHAAVAPWPTRTSEAVILFAKENNERGAQHYPEWVALEQQTRRMCATMINAGSSNDIAFQKNTSEALSVVAHGFPWQTGDNVVICDEEFPSNRIVWESLDVYGVQVKQLALEDGSSPEDTLIRACDHRTRLLSISSVQYASGLRMDLQRLGEHCHKNGIAFCVDAIQGLGVVPHDVDAMHIDFLMADAHKWLLSPEGIAIFYCSEKWREQLKLHEFGWHMIEHHMDYDRKDWSTAESARRFECGSPNMLGIHALHASLSLFAELGVDAIGQAILQRSEYLFEKIRQLNHLSLISKYDINRFAGIVTFRHNSQNNNGLYKHLMRNNVICAQRGGGIRFSPHCYTGLDQLDTALALTNAG